jgi:hypothetical protein
MDTTTQMLIGSLVMNALLILKECIYRIQKSTCCGSEIVFTNPIQRRRKQTKKDTSETSIEAAVV